MTSADHALSPLDHEGVNNAVSHALAAIAAATTPEMIKQAKIDHLGDKSPLAAANRAIRDVEGPRKAEAGKAMGAARARVLEALEAKGKEVAAAAEAARLEREKIDVTAVGPRLRLGARHPLELVMDEISDFFIAMGWEIAEGPELEHEWFNFDALNFDIDHPARAMQDTFYVDSTSVGDGKGDAHLVMRTHTSPVQARVLLERDLPLYIACPGKVFRSDELDQTHTPVFHQVEGLAVDKGLTMAHLKGTLDHFAQSMFGAEARTRLRPSFFPFTEPSAEMDLWFPQKKGGPGWIEWGGCGMVNPNVLRACGIDPDVYTGFAFGMGIERTLMLRHGIADMHDIVEGDQRFSQAFGTSGKGK